MHYTQEIVIDNDEEFKIKLKLHIKHEFLMELRSFGDNLKVIEPKRLRQRLVDNANKVKGLNN